MDSIANSNGAQIPPYTITGGVDVKRDGGNVTITDNTEISVAPGAVCVMGDVTIGAHVVRLGEKSAEVLEAERIGRERILAAAQQHTRTTARPAQPSAPRNAGFVQRGRQLQGFACINLQGYDVSFVQEQRGGAWKFSGTAARFNEIRSQPAFSIATTGIRGSDKVIIGDKEFTWNSVPNPLPEAP